MRPMSDKEYDRMLHIQTTTIGEKPTQSSHYHHYEATPYRFLDVLFENYQLGKADGFVDIGCGKGRVLFYVHHHFRCAVTGIEMNEHLYRMALNNEAAYIQKARMKKSGPIRLECCVAEEYEMDGRDNRFFLFNPFSIQIFRKVIDNILTSVNLLQPEVDIILYYPPVEYTEFLERHTPFRLFQEVKIPRLSDINPRECFHIWRYRQSEQQ